MKFHSTRLAASLLALSLAACGGGGGGSADGAPATNTAGNWLAFDPSSASVTQYAGEGATVSIVATASRRFAAPFNVAIIDPRGIIEPQVALNASSETRFDATLRTVASLATGTHGTTLEVRVCEDAPVTCAKPFPGSPWRVPLTITVKPAINLTALANVAGLGSWSTHGGNAGHTGFVDASFDPAAFSRRWGIAETVHYGNEPLWYGSTAIDAGRAFFVRPKGGSGWELVAVSEDSGEPAWKVDMGNLHKVNPPAAANGRVYVMSTGHQDTFMWVFDQATGALLNKVAMYSQWPDYSAPTVYGTDVYTIADGYGGVGKYSDTEGKLSWIAPATPYAGWSPATDGRHVWIYSTPDNTLVAFNAADGSAAYSIGEPYPYSTYFVATPVVLTGTGLAIVSGDKLAAFDLATRTQAWATTTAAYGRAAYGNGTVYAFGPNGRTFEARAPATGKLLWTTADLGDNFTEVVVTRNLAFVSSYTGTAAIDLATHKTVWTYPKGGSLAVSQRGVLYIGGAGGQLVAVNLR